MEYIHVYIYKDEVSFFIIYCLVFSPIYKMKNETPSKYNEK